MLVQLTDQACVWMQAGVIRFWLCDRNFDCDHCPLDAALRGTRRPAAQDPYPSRPGTSPEARDRGSERSGNPTSRTPENPKPRDSDH